MDLKDSNELPRKPEGKENSRSPFSEYVITIDEFNDPCVAVFNFRNNTWEQPDGEPMNIEFKWCYKPNWLVYDDGKKVLDS